MQLELYNDKVWLSKQPVDFRKSIDGLSSFITENFKLNPTSGLFVFYNKKKDKVKCLFWHKNGFVLFYKRLERGRFQFNFKNKEGKASLSPKIFLWLLAGLNWQEMDRWKELDYNKFS